MNEHPDAAEAAAERLAALRKQREAIDSEIEGLAPFAPLETKTWEGIGAPPVRPYVIEAYLPIGCVSSLYGIGGFGKSRLALQMAAGIATGGGDREDVGRRWIGGQKAPPLGNAVAADGAPVLFCSWEDDYHEQARRLSDISGGTAPWVTQDGLAKLHFANLANDGPAWGVKTGRQVNVVGELQDAGRRIRRRAERMGALLVVLDPLAAAYLGSEIDRSLVRSFLSDWNAWAADVGAAVLLIAHESKTSGVSGSTDWTAGPRSVLTFATETVCRQDAEGKYPKGHPSKSGQKHGPRCPTAARLEHHKANYSKRWDALKLVEGTQGGFRWRVDGTWERQDADAEGGEYDGNLE